MVSHLVNGNSHPDVFGPNGCSNMWVTGGNTPTAEGTDEGGVVEALRGVAVGMHAIGGGATVELTHQDCRAAA